MIGASAFSHIIAQEVLVREVNHRVKNNLSAIMGMLYKEQDRAKVETNTNYLDVLDTLTGRIEGLSTVHDLLSASGWRPLSLSEFCRQVIHAATQGTPLDKTISVEVEDSLLRVNSNQAHHLTLVMNELATNTLKHAMNRCATARIRVQFASDDSRITIVYRDDGPGYPQEILEGNRTRISIGFDLIQGIVKESLRGNVVFENDSGAITNITIRHEPTGQRDGM